MLKYFLYTVALALLITAFWNSNYVDYFWKYLHYKKNRHINIFTSEELKQYNGLDRNELYLAILGNVFDVTKGAKHYGPGQTYNIFVGRDASRNFIDGQFSTEDASDDIINLNGSELLSLNHWLKFYEKEYDKVGILVGRHYDADGNLTPYGMQVKSLIKKAKKAKGNEEALKRKYPPCNTEFDAIKGSRVWCTGKSGGIERDWIGVPRKFYEFGSQSHRCACINERNLDLPNIKEYDNCDSDSSSCFIVK